MRKVMWPAIVVALTISVLAQQPPAQRPARSRRKASRRSALGSPDTRRCSARPCSCLVETRPKRSRTAAIFLLRRRTTRRHLRRRSRAEARAHDARLADADGEVVRRSGLHHPSAEARRDLLHAGAGEDASAGRRRRSRGRWATRRRENAAPTGIDRARVEKALDLAFADPDGAYRGGRRSSTKDRSSASATCRASPRIRSSRAGRWARASRRRCSRCS